MALAAAIEDGPSHAYLFRGPAGSGKRNLARAFAADILATGSPDPGETRRRALLDPSPHPDLVWLKPVGMSHAVADVREQIIHQAPLSPFEGRNRVFVIEAADQLNEESQNAMLKTLEEPPPHAHLILLAADGEAVLATVASRCQLVELDPLSVEMVEAELGTLATPDRARAAARLARGDLDRARLLANDRGQRIRDAVAGMMAASAADELAESPWMPLLNLAKQSGEEAGAEVSDVLDAESKEGIKHTKKEVEEATRRAQRRARTAVLDLSLSLAASWARDWAAVLSAAPEVIFNTDRREQLEAEADGMRLDTARSTVELIAATRSSFKLNVSEELALEALCYRMTRLLNPV